ncbi:Pheophytinase, chloroplastic [Vitis vinifera]|uniref:Pheophytinase, chloroplastic n=1 Tax=Vitis vinifera TaxID=29760 RepID=A0A438ELV2_VITVI|nr:Pheophytinase, chloroplastic [Vitis vinifera]
MASTSCPSILLPFSKVDFPIQRATKFAPSINIGKTHLQKLSISRFSRFRPNGSVVFSRLNDYSVDDSSRDTLKNSPELGVQSCCQTDYEVSQKLHMELAGLFDSLSVCGEQWPCIGSSSWFWSKQVYITHILLLISRLLISSCDSLNSLNSDHWRKNVPVLAKSHRVYSIDLIGYGYSDKPNPRNFGADYFYTFETWATQLNDFCTDVVKDEAFFICNSIGGLVGLQAAVMEPQICKGIMLLNISLRMLHIKKQPWYGKPVIRSFQNLLRNTAMGRFFYRSVATPESVKSILCQCYHDTSQVTEELVQKILLPGLEPGAVDVFLEFICYSGGPLPEELLPQVKCPVLIAWGDKDPWEPIELGRAYGKFDSVEDFIVLPDVGHCPQDEAPNLVNPLVESFVARHASPKASVSV